MTSISSIFYGTELKTLSEPNNDRVSLRSAHDFLLRTKLSVSLQLALLDLDRLPKEVSEISEPNSKMINNAINPVSSRLTGEISNKAKINEGETNTPIYPADVNFYGDPKTVAKVKEQLEALMDIKKNPKSARKFQKLLQVAAEKNGGSIEISVVEKILDQSGLESNILGSYNRKTGQIKINPDGSDIGKKYISDEKIREVLVHEIMHSAGYSHDTYQKKNAFTDNQKQYQSAHEITGEFAL